MSFKFTDAVFKAKLPPTDKAVLNALATRADDGGVCWPSISRIAVDCGYSQTTVKEALARLTHNEILSVVGKVKSRFGFVNKLRLDLEAVIQLGKETTQPSYDPVGRQPRRKTVPTQSSLDPAPGRLSGSTQSGGAHRIRNTNTSEESFIEHVTSPSERFTAEELKFLTDHGFSVNFDDPEEVEYYQQYCRYGIYPPEMAPEVAFWKSQLARLQAEGYMDLDAEIMDCYNTGGMVPLSRVTYGRTIVLVYDYLTDLELQERTAPSCPTCHRELDEEVGFYCPEAKVFDNFLAANKKHTPEDLIARIYDKRDMGLAPFTDVFPGIWKWMSAIVEKEVAAG